MSQEKTSNNLNTIIDDTKESLPESEISNIEEVTVEDVDQKKSLGEYMFLTKWIIENDNKIIFLYLIKNQRGLASPKSNGKDYIFEVLKNGTIIERVNLMEKSFWVFGRLASCNICMQHPTISRYHAVLQYRSESTETEGPGFYIYDLGSTHGTFLNKNRLKPKMYARIQVGHMLKLGCSTRSYILNGPEDDAEEESELTVTELKQKRAEELLKREEEAKEAELKAETEREERRKKEEERGVDWGLGEDADEETDLSENPYAQTTNEELYLDDPKKALRGFFEREGLDLEYDCNEQGMVAEVLHKGKKKEAVVQCALEACRILDRHGVLRQATHESRKRKAKNWEENDYYDSDDDTFLDRTGTIEKKREKRMNTKVPQKAETYESLLEKEKAVAASIADLEKQLAIAQEKNNSANNSSNEEDTLDTFMKELKDSKPDKQTVSKLKLELTKLKGEHANVIRLVNIAKPASLPPLVPQYVSIPSTSNDMSMRMKREVEEDTVEGKNKVDEKSSKDTKCETNTSSEVNEANIEQAAEGGSDSSSNSSSDEDIVDAGEFSTIKSLHNTMTFKKFEKILKKGLPPFAEELSFDETTGPIKLCQIALDLLRVISI
ncbi:hypothetical protein NQ314_013428 [Rhamnusium bicolor]|uniref:FHA domain-containing protein n=1 Tax=Rhamnusium bicolor TaxID=1586634 RepID=A0AAV8X6H1_9CUCU|nr:hypothetical protein NQ314_013428 [Rhamnusium bicolor]